MRTSTRKLSRFVAEMLERRSLLSAGSVDPTFHGAFVSDPQSTQNAPPFFENNIVSLATQGDGKLLALGNAGSPEFNGHGDIFLNRFNSDGTSDQISNVPPDNRFIGQVPIANTMLVQANGQVLVGGYVESSGSGPIVDHFLLARVNSNLVLDSSFGTNGMTVTSLPGNQQITSLALMPDGEILAEGPSFIWPNVGFYIARYSSTGALESQISYSLGSNGGLGGPKAMVLQKDGKILVGGAAGTKPTIWRFNPNLTIDTSFGTAGVSTISLAGTSGSLSALSLQSDGKIVAAGSAVDLTGKYGKDTYVLTRLNSNGAIDASYGSAGITWVSIPTTTTPYPLAGIQIESDGKVVLAGTAQNPAGGTEMIVRRFLVSGAPDPSFQNDGISRIDPFYSATTSNVADAIALDNFNRVLIAGTASTTYPLGTGFTRALNDVTPPGLSVNYGGKPININAYPVEAEDFDRGGQGAGYNDTTPSQNTGGAYRPAEGVDIATDHGGAQGSYTTNGYAVTDTHPGEWLDYTIYNPTTAIYRVRADVSSVYSGGQFHVLMDGVNVSGEMTAYDSIGDAYFDTDSNAFMLSAGVHVMRVVMDKAGPSGQVANFDRFFIDEGGGGSFNMAPFNIATDTVEAENFMFDRYYDTTPTNDVGAYRPFEPVDILAGGSNGFHVVNVYKHEYFDYVIQSPTNSVYTLQARVAAFKPGGTFHVEIDGVNVTGPMVVPNSGPWDTWTTITSKAFAVTPTKHLMSVVMDQGGFYPDVVGDFDFFKFVKTTAVAPPLVLHGNPYHGAPIDVSSRVIEAEDFDSPNTNGVFYSGEGVTYHDTTPQNLGGQYRWDDGVDISPSFNPAHDPLGYALSYTEAGEWLNYTISIPTTGTWVLQSVVANTMQGGQFHMEIDGVNKTGAITVPNTGGWSTWQTIASPSFALTAGTHVMRIKMDKNNAGGNIANFDYFQIVPATIVSHAAMFSQSLTPSSSMNADQFSSIAPSVSLFDTTQNTSGQIRPTDGGDLNADGTKRLKHQAKKRGVSGS